MNLALKALRAICAAWPEVRETTTFGHPTFQVGRKTFCVLERYRGEWMIAFKSTLARQKQLVKKHRFIVTPYSGRYGWVSLIVDGKTDWREVAALVESSYRLIAPKRTAALLAPGATAKHAR